MSDLVNFLDKKAEKLMPQNAVHGGTVRLQYKDTDFSVGAPYNHLIDACKNLSDMGRDQRRGVMASVNKSISKNLPLMDEGLLNNTDAMNLSQDITIWYANEIFCERKNIDELDFM